MEVLSLILVLVLNLVISIWNCNIAGSAWKDTMAFGSFMDKLVLKCAIVQSSIGFSLPILMILLYIGKIFLTFGDSPHITPQEAEIIVNKAFSFWYILVVLPLLGTGTIIWIYSLKEAWQKKDFFSISLAGWNTYAQIHNSISIINDIGGHFSSFSNFFSDAFDSKDSSGKEKLILLVVIIVFLSLISGILIACYLTKYFAKKTESRLEVYARDYNITQK